MSPFPTNWNRYLSAPLTSSASLRRRLRKEVPLSDARLMAEQMLKGCTPKTTPLYLRLIQAFACWLIDNQNASPNTSKTLAVEVAKAVKRYDLTLD
ncbi:MAG: hypothetical protein VXZ96_19205 [Myxococcota bacterium]|nr:hypothetical protein [Myxococcota bacterium]